ncbi:MAG TPA: serine/threonine-protein kinase [Vicinamibacterales bacterium]|nr:serine/threonine-protein kinase [Vicinamibacterales bacterium]
MLAPGAKIDDRYEIIGALGAGGMGAVYRARRLHLGDEVAIKVMHASADAPPESRDRFLRESRACAQLRHPNIVGLLDFGFDTGDQPYMVMELLSGPSLLEEIKLEAPMAPARVIAILESVASALQLAHDRGITHRDLKPANIVAHKYESGERVYKVIDFGLAAMKAANDETRLTDPAFFLGTLAYAAPEQLRGEEVTSATDVYAIGVIAHEMLTGGRPFDSSNKATLVTKILTIDPARDTTRKANLPQAVDDAVMKALSKDPADRWPSVSAFIDALKAAVGQALSPVMSAGESGLLSRYELGPMLGRGRLGSVVYQGTHRALGTPVAIRVLKREEQPHWDAVRARFLLEARTLQASHPSLLQVRDFGEDDRGVYVVSDLVEGPSLRQAMTESGPFAWVRAKHLITQALEAVSVLHARGGFICGVNPDMIRLRSARSDGATADNSGEQIVISSAGIKSVQDVLATMREQELRGHEASATELPYVAPEVLMGFAPNARADVFTIGVLAYQMVTGSVPLTAPSLPELIGQMLQTKPAPPQGDLPPAARDAIMKSIDSVPANRFESADAFARALA